MVVPRPWAPALDKGRELRAMPWVYCAPVGIAAHWAPGVEGFCGGRGRVFSRGQPGPAGAAPHRAADFCCPSPTQGSAR